MKVIVEINDKVAEQYKNINSVVHHLLYCELYKVTSENEITVTNAAELEAKASKWDDPQTQANLELAAAIRAAFEKSKEDENTTSIAINAHVYCGGMDISWAEYIVDCEADLLEWYREQKRGAE